MIPLLGADLKSLASKNRSALKQQHTHAIQRFLSQFSTIFTPLIPGFIAIGLMLGVAAVLEQLFVSGSAQPVPVIVSGIQYLRVFSKGLFSFLTILIGYNAQQTFGGSGVNGAILASLFIMSYDPESVVGIYAGMSDFFGRDIAPRGSIVGVLLVAVLGAQVEKRVRQCIPDHLQMLLTSVITLLIMGAATFTVIMPLGGVLFEGMSWLFPNLNGHPLGGAVLSGLFLVAVMLGVHQGFIPVYFALVEAQGFNSLFPILAMGGAGQVGAVLALYVKSPKRSLLRRQIKGAIVPGIMGIGEPLIYAVTLPRVKPFITACIGGAGGGLFIGTVAWLGLPVGLNTVYGPSGILALPLMTSDAGILSGVLVMTGGLLVSYVSGFTATWYYGSKNVDLS